MPSIEQMTARTPVADHNPASENADGVLKQESPASHAYQNPCRRNGDEQPDQDILGADVSIYQIVHALKKAVSVYQTTDSVVEPKVPFDVRTTVTDSVRGRWISAKYRNSSMNSVRC